MIYTTYFGCLRRIPTDVIPVSIAAKPPKWWDGLEYKKLAPSYGCLMDYKSGGNRDTYINRYYKETLEHLDPYETVYDIIELLPSSTQLSISMVNCPLWENPHIHVALVCYEIPEDFCHRHIDRAWFTKYGVSCEEFRVGNHKCLDIDISKIIEKEKGGK